MFVLLHSEPSAWSRGEGALGWIGVLTWIGTLVSGMFGRADAGLLAAQFTQGAGLRQDGKRRDANLRPQAASGVMDALALWVAGEVSRRVRLALEPEERRAVALRESLGHDPLTPNKSLHLKTPIPTLRST